VITIVGGLPEPVGGVTNFLSRFSGRFESEVDRVIDLYPAANKQKLKGVTSNIRPKSKLLSAIWLPFQIYRCTVGIIYYNFSSPRALLLLLFLPKLKKSSWALTLHHGALSESMSNSSVVLSRLVRIAIRRVDRIGFISERQRNFYKAIGVDSARLYSISTYLPYVDADFEVSRLDCGKVNEKLEVFKRDFSKLVIASGYPTSLYRHDWVLRYFERIQLSNAGLVICLYGEDSEELLRSYKEWARKLPNVLMFNSLSPAEFQQVLRNGDIYVRPTLTDSYGVAVAEALECGLVVIASDVCERTQGAHVFASNSRGEFESMLENALNGSLSATVVSVENGAKSLQSFLSMHE